MPNLILQKRLQLEPVKAQTNNISLPFIVKQKNNLLNIVATAVKQ